MSTEWAYHSAKQLLQEMKDGKLTSRQLLDYYIKRIERLNPQLNAVVATDYSAARARADAADKARSEGENWGPLHGLPMTVKDTYEVVGMPCVAGAPSLKDHLPKKDAVTIENLKQAGAIIFGKTNVPLFASDLQSYNKVYGTSHNPWNTQYTPGGSSGGAAAALAAGFTPVELGSDIGGSIRTPAHFCGVFGHKTTHGVISLRGHIPGPPGVLSETDLAVSGPMARTADDLQLILDVVSGPSPLMQPGWQLKLPAVKQRKLQDFKVLLWMDDPLCPIASEMKSMFDDLKQSLEQQGVSVTVGAPMDMALKTFYPLYLRLLGGVLGSSHKKIERTAMGLAAPLLQKFGDRFQLPKLFENYLEGASQSHVDWLRDNERRYRLREKFLQTFEKYDVILCPINMTTSFRHNQEQDIFMRKLSVDGKMRNYTDMFMWIAPATVLGLPATSAPIGVTKDGLPVNVQIMGGAYQDKTTIRFARFMEKAGFTFQPPAGY
ncbi:MAG: amidase [Pseudomonadales bacterium]|nr:amidase [Pseudomonadales bacterium]